MLAGNTFSESNCIIQVQNFAQDSSQQNQHSMLRMLRGGFDESLYLATKHGHAGENKLGIHGTDTTTTHARDGYGTGVPRVIAVDGPAASGKVGLCFEHCFFKDMYG